MVLLLRIKFCYFCVLVLISGFHNKGIYGKKNIFSMLTMLRLTSESVVGNGANSNVHPASLHVYCLGLFGSKCYL